MKNIFATLPYILEKKQDAVLVTIIQDQGSTPRGVGSQMLVNRQGLLTGTIGGGAIEKRSVEIAMEMIGSRKSLIHDFELRKDAREDIGMECGGDASVYFQYIEAADNRWMELAKALTEQLTQGLPGWLVQNLDGAFPFLVDGEGTILYGAEGQAKLNDETLLKSYGVHGGNLFSMPIPVGERVIIFGAGHCALALAPVLHSVGFRVTVMDDRESLLTKERYPEAEHLIAGDFTRIEDYIELQKEDYVVVMTSGHTHDFEVEEQVLRKTLAYVGVIGSRRKTASVNGRLREAGVAEEMIQSVHTPIGLSIKAVTPEEIAVSIAAEMILVRASLREKQQPDMHHCPV